MAINCEQGFNLGISAMEARPKHGVCILYREDEKSIEHLLINAQIYKIGLVRSGAVHKSEEYMGWELC